MKAFRESVFAKSQIVANAMRKWMELLTAAYMLCILWALPFYFTKGYARIGSDKAQFLHGCMLIFGCLFAASFLVYGMQFLFIGKQIKIHLSKTDLFVVLYFAAVCLSYLFTPYKQTALFGETGWYMGFCMQIFMLFMYICISRFSKHWPWILYGGLICSFFVFLLGFLNRFSIYPIPMQYASESYLSTIGNMNWYCGYLVSILFAAVTIYLGNEKLSKPAGLAYAGYLVTGFASLLTQGSLSGILTLIAVMGVLFLYALSKGILLERYVKLCVLFATACCITFLLRKLGFGHYNYIEPFTEPLIHTWISFGLLLFCLILCGLIRRSQEKNFIKEKTIRKVQCTMIALVCICVFVLIGLVVVHTKNPEQTPYLPDSLFLFSDEWGSKRGATWKIGFMCFHNMDWLHKIVGAGPDCLYECVVNLQNGEILRYCKSVFGLVRVTNAHNEWLTILVNYGIFGLFAFAGIIVSAMLRLLHSPKATLFTKACGICLLAYTVNNIVSFEQPMNLATVFVILGMGEAALSKASAK